jgi:hypothetical protein
LRAIFILGCFKEEIKKVLTDGEHDNNINSLTGLFRSKGNQVFYWAFENAQKKIFENYEKKLLK